MKSTLSDNKQIFNVKEIAYDTTIENLGDDQFGIFPEGVDTSVSAGTTFATLPKKFRIISKVEGKPFYSFETIDKNKMLSQQKKAYQSEQINIWKTTIKNCDCINSLQVNVGLNESGLIRRDGLTWTHSDSIFTVPPHELECLCDCTGKGVYENNVMTKLVYERINANNSPYYEAEVQKEDGTVFADSTAIQAFIDANKAVNTDDDDTNDGEFLVLVIKGKLQPAKPYKDLDRNYINPRGVQLSPVIVINEKVAVTFTEVQALRFELNAGADMRAEEWECMSLHTDLNFMPVLSDGFAVDNLFYQFENKKDYDTLTLEFDTKKVERAGDGDMKRFSVVFGSETGNGVINTLSTMLTPA